MHAPLISANALHALLSSPDLVLFDCRFALMDAGHGARAYARSHLPGAHFIDVNRSLSAPHVAGKTSRHPLPARETWVNTVQQLGLTPSSHVVLYDDGGGSSSARCWWMLKWIGHDKVSVLDGGWQYWRDNGYPLTDLVPAPRAAVANAYAGLAPLVELITADQVDGSRQTLIDARDLPRFRGDVEPIDPVAGHIPGAVCSPFSANLAADGRFEAPSALQEKFAGVLGGGKPVVCYCGSGITACHNILAMAAAALPLPALYAGSWSEWITDPSRGVAKGD